MSAQLQLYTPSCNQIINPQIIFTKFLYCVIFPSYKYYVSINVFGKNCKILIYERTTAIPYYYQQVLHNTHYYETHENTAQYTHQTQDRSPCFDTS